MTYVQDQTGLVFSTQSPEHHPNTTKLSAAKGRAAVAEQDKQQLLKLLKPGDTICCVLRHVSSSGMSRRIDFYVTKNNELVYLSGYIGSLLGYRRGAKDGLVVSGCGMDMGFEVVYNLGRALWPGGFVCIGDNCRSNDHSNGDRNRKPHQHSDYALKYNWI